MSQLVQSFVLILTGLKATLAEAMSANRSRADFLMIVWKRFNDISKRFERLFARWKAGTLPKLRSRPARPRADRTPPIRLPTRRLWLILEVRKTTEYRSLLRHLFGTDPEFVAFLNAAPQARRLLNPICRALGIDLDAPYGVPLGLPPHKNKPRRAAAPPQPKPKAERPRKPRRTPGALPAIFSSA